MSARWAPLHVVDIDDSGGLREVRWMILDRHTPCRAVGLSDGFSGDRELERRGAQADALDLVFTDLCHPGPHGFENLRRLRGAPAAAILASGLRLSATPALVMSGICWTPSMAEAGLTTTEFLACPFKGRTFLSTVAGVLTTAAHRLLGELRAAESPFDTQSFAGSDRQACALINHWLWHGARLRAAAERQGSLWR